MAGWSLPFTLGKGVRAMLSIEAPDIAPARGGLLPHANVVDMGSGPFGLDGVAYLADPCGPALRVPTVTEKQFDQRAVVTGSPFSVYRGIDESLFQAEDVVRRVFDRGESFAVEQAVEELILNGPAQVDITPTPGTAVPVKHALALAEQYAAENYMGLPLIHVSRFGAIILGGELEPDTDEWLLHTKQGTPVANGAGYAAPASGSTNFWLYVTGQVNIFRGPVEVLDGRDLTYNRVLSLAERTYVPTVECFVAAVLATL